MHFLQPVIRRMCVIALIGITLNTVVWSQDSPLDSFLHFSIAAQPLGSALLQYSLATGMDIFMEDGMVEGLRSPGVSGLHTAGEALEQLLDGTGLYWRLNGGNVVTLEFAAEPVVPAVPFDEVLSTPDMLQSPPNRESFALEPVHVRGTREEDAVYLTPASVSVITRRDIERFRGTSVGDIFQGETGVLIGENRNSGGLDVNIRGMQGQGRVPVIVDGARQETTVYRGYAGVSSRSYVDPDLIGGIRIDKGPTMDAQGAGTTGGMVTMRTIDATDIIKPGNVWGIRLRGSLLGNNSGSPAKLGTPSGYFVGSGEFTLKNNECDTSDCAGSIQELRDSFASDESMNRPDLLDLRSLAGSVALARRFDWGSLVAAYAERSQGNYYAGKHGPVPWVETSSVRYPFETEVKAEVHGLTRFRGEELIVNSNFENQTWLFKALFHIDETQSWELGYMRYESAHGEIMPSQLLGTVRQTVGSVVTTDTYSSRYHWDPDHDWLNMKLNIWLTRSETLNRLYQFEDDEMGSIGETLTSWAIPEEYQRWGADITNTMDFYGANDLQLRYGGAWQSEDVRYGRDARREEYSAFVATKWQFAPTLTLDAGIRSIAFTSKDRNLLATHVGDGHYRDNVTCLEFDEDGVCLERSNPETTYIQFENSHHGTAPLTSLTWEPVTGLQLYGRYARGVRMPSLFESSLGFSVQPAMDIPIKPERTESRELGVNLLRDGVFVGSDRVRLKFAAFQNTTKDYITRTMINAGEGNPYALSEEFRLRNIESASFHGFEVSAKYDLRWLFAGVSATRYTEIELCHEGTGRREKCTDYGLGASYVNNMIPPNHNASAELGVRLFAEKLELGARGTFMGKRNQEPLYNNDTRGVFAPPVQWHSYQVYDLFASYQPNEWVTLDFRTYP
ncbi:TonB-dependent receptor [Desulfurispirillum indicum S5]|uniref:TonB-dependent receptor n=1 Tax=Desulfurispirillum indicum (strain ATCC BAA-1389 / DSM 22839 / S5) TaxID=653733 RepID=E6W1A3_DESIS|nr:TonB-dependent receptor [Desulfurispirillum indicum]ADU66523.1 TonB-dependent receptor [Desulfurispirillum indicum S5]